MKYASLAAAGVALVALSPAIALADDTMATITNIDANTASVTLSDGYTYKLPASVALSSLMYGEHVTVTYATDATGKRTATAVMPAP